MSEPPRQPPEESRHTLEDDRGAPLDLRLTRPLPGGDAPPRGQMVYLHGFRSHQGGEKAEYFRRRTAELGWSFASFDSTGHGESAGDLGSTTLSRNLEDLDRVLAWLGEPAGGGPRVLFGSSLGGATVLWYLARRPEAAHGAVTIAPAVGLGAFLDAALGEEGRAAWREAGVRRLEDDLGTLDLDWGFVEDLGKYDPAALAERLRVPTLVFQGRRDEAVGWQGAVELATCTRPGLVDLHLFGGGDHRLLEYRPVLWRHVEAFLGRLT